jgi:NadR type nicotinamide-nucleotide adenylyltransferase
MDSFAPGIVVPDPLRVVLTGSESVGKTTLAAQLAAHYGVPFVPEFVREYAARKGASLDFRDHGPIAKGQMALEDEYRARAESRGDAVIIQDTDLTSTVVYCHHYFGQCPAFIEEAAVARAPDLYILLDIDVPWVADGVRDRSDRRGEVQAMFAGALAKAPSPVVHVSGDWHARFTASVRAIDALRVPLDHTSPD